ncbi:type VI secretion system baseplate subunit TssG [Reinekea sp.]|jgi:predicted component of type VI protein secretion system|uniref:type VI secretion system baseplate subunit TssG n=1 Tax=Reinekea sp. TaxID=1970455 RepID=UPI002A82D127|nr:type VI secretion system baseplate subunit TssG [Reinekea sp.]
MTDSLPDIDRAAERSAAAVNEFGPLLPAFYLHQLESDEQGPLPAFLALLLAPLHAQARAMTDHYQPVLQQTRHARSSFANFQHSEVLADLAEAGLRLVSTRQWERLNSLFSDVTGSWQGAVALLVCLFPGKSVSLVEGVAVERYLPSQQMTGLAGTNALGAHSVLGYKLEDRMNGCRFLLATFSAQDLQEYASDDYLALVQTLLKRYVGQPLAIELVFRLASDAQKSTGLAEPGQAILGVKTWLAATELQEKEIVIAL